MAKGNGTVDKEAGERLRALRRNRRMTQVELGGAVGRDEMTVRRWEKGYMGGLLMSNLEYAHKVAATLGCEADDFLPEPLKRDDDAVLRRLDHLQAQLEALVRTHERSVASQERWNRALAAFARELSSPSRADRTAPQATTWAPRAWN